ncbi:MAG: hypothetical protein AAF639_20650 [Chloroflexota bacterium]
MQNSQVQDNVLNTVSLPYNVIPTPMVLRTRGDETSLVRNLAETAGSNTKQTELMGSIVTSPDKQGALAMVAPYPQPTQIDGRPAVSLLVQTQSASAMPEICTLHFHVPNNSKQLALSVGPVTAPGVSFTSQGAQIKTILLDVGPGAVSIGTNQQHSPTGAELDSNWSQVLDIAKKVAPVIGNAGIEIYHQLANSSESNSFWGTVGSIAKAAAPIALSLLA